MAIALAASAGGWQAVAARKDRYRAHRRLATTASVARYHGMTDRKPPIPLDSLVFGYGPMLPFVAAAIGAWVLPSPWPARAIDLAVIWGGLILAFVAGVRRGYGFGNANASTRHEIMTMMVYFVLAGAALICGWIGLPLFALALLAIGYAMVMVLDRIGARNADVPGYFSRLRPPQMAFAVVSIVALIARVLIPL